MAIDRRSRRRLSRKAKDAPRVVQAESDSEESTDTLMKSPPKSERFIVEPERIKFYVDTDFSSLSKQTIEVDEPFQEHDFSHDSVCHQAPTQLAVILSFFRTFESMMYLDPFSTDDLVYALDRPDDSVLFEKILQQLIMLYQNRENPSTSKRYVETIRGIVKKHVHLFIGDIDFIEDWSRDNLQFLYQVDAKARANVVFNMCDWTAAESVYLRACAEQLIRNGEIESSMDSIGLRNLCLGCDRYGRFYYYFDGFVQQTSYYIFRTIIDDRASLEIVTCEFSEMKALAEYFRKDSDDYAKALAKVFDDVLLPVLDRKRRVQLVREEMLHRSLNYRRSRPKRSGTQNIDYAMPLE